MRSRAFVLKQNFFSLNELPLPYEIVHTDLFLAHRTKNFKRLITGIWSPISRLKGMCSVTLGYRFLLLSKTLLSDSTHVSTCLGFATQISLSSVYG